MHDDMLDHGSPSGVILSEGIWCYLVQGVRASPELHFPLQPRHHCCRGSHGTNLHPQRMILHFPLVRPTALKTLLVSAVYSILRVLKSVVHSHTVSHYVVSSCRFSFSSVHWYLRAKANPCR